MKTVADRRVLQSLEARLARLEPESARRWGTLTPHEMLCHLGDAAAMVLRTRPRKSPLPARRRPLTKALGLLSPFPWPRGRPTNPFQNPRVDGTKPTDFARDRARAVAGLHGIADATGGLEPVHGMFGNMTVRDWQRWAYLHTDHHLRQFGL